MKIENKPPFQEYDCYLNFHKQMGRWQVCLNSKTGKSRTILYSKFLMSIKEGRILEAHEQVDHVNGDKSDDRIENLEIVTEAENKARYLATLSKAMVTLICPQCNIEFTRERRQTHLVKGGDRTFCSRICVRNSQKKSEYSKDRVKELEKQNKKLLEILRRIDILSDLIAEKCPDYYHELTLLIDSVKDQ